MAPGDKKKKKKVKHLKTCDVILETNFTCSKNLIFSLNEVFVYVSFYEGGFLCEILLLIIIMATNI